MGSRGCCGGVRVAGNIRCFGVAPPSNFAEYKYPEHILGPLFVVVACCDVVDDYYAHDGNVRFPLSFADLIGLYPIHHYFRSNSADTKIYIDY